MYDQGYHVVGLDGIEEPVRDFFEENEMEFKREIRNSLVCYSVSLSISCVFEAMHY